MNLREQMQIDVQNTFFNANEFATNHKIDGREMLVIVDTSDNEHPLYYAEGVSVLRKIIHVESAVLGYTPREGQILSFDGQRYTAAQVIDADGIFSVTLEANLD